MINLNKLDREIDDLFEGETNESLTTWLKNNRNKQTKKINKKVTVMKTNNNWVSIKDKLPERDKKVLVFITSNDLNKEWSDIRIDAIHTRKGKKYWSHFSGLITNVVITHWMPLPSPPKKN